MTFFLYLLIKTKLTNFIFKIELDQSKFENQAQKKVYVELFFKILNSNTPILVNSDFNVIKSIQMWIWANTNPI